MSSGPDKSVLFAGDRRFRTDQAGVYTEGGVDADAGLRYLQWFHRLTVFGRSGGRAAASIPAPDVPGRLEFILHEDARRGVRRLGAVRLLDKALEQAIAAHDAVIARMPSLLGWRAAEIALRVGKPLAIDLCACVFDDLASNGNLVGNWLGRLARLRFQSVIGRCQWVSYVTQSYLQGRYPAAIGARTVAIPNVSVRPLPEGHVQVRHSRLCEKTKLVFGTVGSLHGSVKGIDIALKALRRYAQFNQDFEYRVLGHGDHAQLSQLAHQYGLGSRVFFDGPLAPGEPVYGWLDGVDVYLQPSRREGTPRALIEAMSRACPVVASSVGGIPEILGREWLHPSGDATRLCELLVKMTVDRQLAVEGSLENLRRSHLFSSTAIEPNREAFWVAFRESFGPG